MSFAAFHSMMDDHYRRLARKRDRADVKRAQKPGLVLCTNHDPKALTRRPMKLEARSILPDLRHSSRRLRRNRWVAR